MVKTFLTYHKPTDKFGNISWFSCIIFSGMFNISDQVPWAGKQFSVPDEKKLK